ncbi:hypothetical protein Q7P35_006811 [Cladosporium inversicolor]
MAAVARPRLHRGTLTEEKASKHTTARSSGAQESQLNTIFEAVAGVCESVDERFALVREAIADKLDIGQIREPMSEELGHAVQGDEDGTTTVSERYSSYQPTDSLPSVIVEEVANAMLNTKNPASPPKVGRKWVANFVKRHLELSSVYNRKFDIQRAEVEDPELISVWFRLVGDTITKYGVLEEDIFNFDGTGFQMGVTSTSKVITTSDRKDRLKTKQPGNRKWVTAIEAISAIGQAIPPFIIFDVAVSDNGWTINWLGLEWIQHFHGNTKNHFIIPDRAKAPYSYGSGLALTGEAGNGKPRIGNCDSERHLVGSQMSEFSSQRGSRVSWATSDDSSLSHLSLRNSIGAVSRVAWDVVLREDDVDDLGEDVNGGLMYLYAWDSTLD